MLNNFHRFTSCYALGRRRWRYFETSIASAASIRLALIQKNTDLGDLQIMRHFFSTPTATGGTLHPSASSPDGNLFFVYDDFFRL